MNKLSMVCLLLAMLLGVCFGAITWTSMSIPNGRTAYYSANCTVDKSKVKSVTGFWTMTLSQCITNCNLNFAKGANVFSYDATSVSCYCYQRNKAVAPYPFIEMKQADKSYCGCIEPSSAK